MRSSLLSIPFVVSLSIVASAQDAGDTKYDPISYFLGISMGQQMAQNGLRADDFQESDLLAGVRDGIGKKDAALTDEQLAATQQKLQSLLEKRMRAPGEAYLAKVAKKEGVKKLAGGLMYEVIESGKGESPTATDTVAVHYTGKRVDGRVFDTSLKPRREGDPVEPATFRVGQVIKGWQMALQKMKVGDKWTLYIPSDLAYGAMGSPPSIPPFEPLTFEVELLEIQ